MPHHDDLAQFVADRRDEIIARWADHVVTALSLNADDPPQLVNDLPTFLDDVVLVLRDATANPQHRGSARSHGRQRKHIGVDIGALALELSLVGETVLELAEAHGFAPTLAEVRALMRTIAQGTEQSVTEYAALRDHEIADQAARHYSFIAHELRTPLQNARFAASLLSQGLGDPAHHLDRLARAIEEVTGVVDSSLVGTRLQGSPTPRYERFATRVLLQQAAEACHFAAERRGVAVQLAGEDFELEADRKLVASLLTNLVSNAIKFTPQGREVTLRCARVEDRARFEVADYCGGMPDDLPGRLFQPHVQEGGDRSGFGLGLVIVKQAVDAHGGTIRVVNEPGFGCCFVVDLPLVRLVEP